MNIRSRLERLEREFTQRSVEHSGSESDVLHIAIASIAAIDSLGLLDHQNPEADAERRFREILRESDVVYGASAKRMLNDLVTQSGGLWSRKSSELLGRLRQPGPTTTESRQEPSA